MYQEPAVYVDIETSGGNYQTSRIIEIAAIRVEENEITEVFSSLVNPGHSLPYWISQLTGITDVDVVQAPYFNEIAYQLHNLLDHAVFIAHNVRFDFSYIKHELAACGYDISPRLLCTVRLSRALYPAHHGHSLEKIIDRHNLSVNNRHRAYDDAMAIKQFAELAFQEKGDRAWQTALAKQFKHQTLPPHLSHQSLNKATNTPGVYIYESKDAMPLYVGKSVATRNRLLSHFREDIHTEKEMNLSRSVHKIKVISTHNELEALLLESSLIKQLQLSHNHRLRQKRYRTVLNRTLDSDGYIGLQPKEIDIAELTHFSDIYGVFNSKQQAKSSIEHIIRSDKLCPSRMNQSQIGKPCLLYQLGKCYGACLGLESSDSYNARLDSAFQTHRIAEWPFDSPVSLTDEKGSGVVLDQWILLGYIRSLRQTGPKFKPVTKNFDFDTYQILKRFILKKPESYHIAPFDVT